jgi:hypothetical protein
VEESRAILAALRGPDETRVDDRLLRELQEACDSFLSHRARPGNAAPLLRDILELAREENRPATRRDVLDALSGSTGIPAELLDDAAPLDLDRVGAFFSERIVGQPEAVSSVVDAVTLIKSGLTDPEKPFSVMLFVGPTGVGKTELARALAEFIFGDPKRLLRFDMSEFAGADGFTRLIGGRGENGLLTEAVLQRPFSVVLLDEIEKSHLNVFDLCLQIFDAGRLTDGRGRRVDFRRTVVILTSNIGAETQSNPLGFARPASSPSGEGDRTFKELSRFFRPEFLNRIDRIVNFRPLSLETAERIARRELEHVLQRSGVQRRGLTVSLDPDVIALLVREGYSPHFGARPIKRTVEKLILMPMARAIAAGQAAPGSLVRIRVEAGAVGVQLSAPTPREPATATAPSRRRDPRKTRLDSLEERLRAVVVGTHATLERKSLLLERTHGPDFHRDAAERGRVFDEIRRIDQFAARVEGVRDGLLRLETAPAEDPEGESAAELEAEIGHLELLVANPDPVGLADAFLLLTRTAGNGDPLEAVDMLVGTLVALARRRRFEAEVIASRLEDRHDVAVVEVAGLGASALLLREAGLHEFNRRRRARNPRNGREQTFNDTALVRVDVYPELSEPPKRFATLTSLKAVATAAGPRFGNQTAFRITGFHEPSIRALELDFVGTKSAALDRATRFFHAQVAQPVGTTDAVIRRYDIGIGSRIKYLRSGRSTTRLAQFFRGQVDLPPTPED